MVLCVFVSITGYAVVNNAGIVMGMLRSIGTVAAGN